MSARPELFQAHWMKPVALVLLVLQLVISIAMLPDSPFAHLAEPTYLAALASIGAGIIAHGLGWDLWHHGRSSYVPDWYSAACLVVDLGIGAFALAYLRRAGASGPISPRDALLHRA